jgi:alpha-2-macroglobulin
MVDALPYLVDYPYGCTEQTLNRFLPTVITQKVLQGHGLDLAAIREKRTNLNAQEIGDDASAPSSGSASTATRSSTRRKVERMVKEGVKR